MKFISLFKDGIQILTSNSSVWFFGLIIVLSSWIGKLIPNRSFLSCLSLFFSIVSLIGVAGIISCVANTTEKSELTFQSAFTKSKADFWNLLVIQLKLGFLLLILAGILFMINWVIFEVTQDSGLEAIWLFFLVISILIGVYFIFVFWGVSKFSFCEAVLKNQNSDQSLKTGRDIFQKNQWLYFKFSLVLFIASMGIYVINILCSGILLGFSPFELIRETLSGNFIPHREIISNHYFLAISAIISFISTPYYSTVETLFYIRVTNYSSTSYLQQISNDPLHQLPPPLP